MADHKGRHYIKNVRPTIKVGPTEQVGLTESVNFRTLLFHGWMLNEETRTWMIVREHTRERFRALCRR
jgi:hypothetical protein